MKGYGIVPAVAVNPIGLAVLNLMEEAVAAAQAAARRKKLPGAVARRRGRQLQPGRETPLWNELMRQVRAEVHVYGAQAQLARVLDLPRQRLNRCLKAEAAMLDAERTLLLVGWLAARRSRAEVGTPPVGV